MATTKHARVPESVYKVAKDIQEEYGYPSVGEAFRHVFREEGHDV